MFSFVVVKLNLALFVQSELSVILLEESISVCKDLQHFLFPRSPFSVWYHAFLVLFFFLLLPEVIPKYFPRQRSVHTHRNLQLEMDVICCTIGGCLLY